MQVVVIDSIGGTAHQSPVLVKVNLNKIEKVRRRCREVQDNDRQFC